MYRQDPAQSYRDSEFQAFQGAMHEEQLLLQEEHEAVTQKLQESNTAAEKELLSLQDECSALKKQHSSLAEGIQLQVAQITHATLANVLQTGSSEKVTELETRVLEIENEKRLLESEHGEMENEVKRLKAEVDDAEQKCRDATEVWNAKEERIRNILDSKPKESMPEVLPKIPAAPIPQEAKEGGLEVGTTQADRPLFGEGGWFVDNGDRGKCNICGEIRMKNGGSGKKNAGTSNLRAHLRCHHNLPGSGKPKELGVTHGTSTTDLCVLKDLVCKPLNFFRNIKCLYNVSHQQSMMDKIAVFFCQNKIALQVVEDPTFTGITSAPAGVTRRSLLAHIEKLGNTCRQKLLKRFEGDDVTIMFDGATLPGKRRVLNFSIHNGHMALFFRSVVVTSFSAADALKVLRSITTELLEANVVPLAFCADNAKSMQNALKEAALPVSMYLKKQTLPAAQHFTN